MGEQGLFGDLGSEQKAAKQKSGGEPRVKRPNRRQGTFTMQVLDDLLPADHRARSIVAAVERLNLSSFYDGIQARGSDAGRPATDPAMLLALWLFATSEGVGSARQLERLCSRDDAYRWICGGVAVNQHTLSDFRVAHASELDNLLSQVLAVLMHEGVVQLRRVAQDGVRVRASAGAASFRSKRGLRKCLKEAREQVKRVRKLLDQDDPTRSARQRAAMERAARQREQTIDAAMDTLQQLQGERTGEKAEKVRVSTTDPEARVMKMPDGGYRPAFNVQLATDADSRVVVGVRVARVGSDKSQIVPMLDDIERRTGRKPEQLLVDGGYVNLKQIEEAANRGVEVFAPPQQPRTAKPPKRKSHPDSAAVAQWRERMQTRRGKRIYRDRAAVAECVNADLRAHRGLRQIPVRGIDKALSIGLWMALTYNCLQWIRALPPMA